MLRVYFILLIFFNCCVTAFAQDTTKNLSASLLKSTFTSHTENHKPRAVLSIKNKKTIAKLNPLLYVGIGLMYFYQNVVSEQIQADCTYQISCSEYTKKSIEKKGFAKGTLSGFNQLYNCFPGTIYEKSEYLINADGKVNNVLDEEN